MAPENNVQEILKSLTKLETSLEQLDSARKQVEDVVEVAARVNNSLGEYAQSLNSVTDAVKGFTAAAHQAHQALAEETYGRLQQISDKIDAAIDTLKPAPQNVEDNVTAHAPIASETAGMVAEQLAILPELKENIDKLLRDIEGIKTAPSSSTAAANNSGTGEESFIAQFEAINSKVEMVSAQIDSIAMRLSSVQASAPATTSNNALVESGNVVAAVRQELAEFEDKLNLIAKDVMVMRNSTHSILKNMETQLIDRSSKESRASLIIAIGALVAFVIVLLKIYGAI